MAPFPANARSEQLAINRVMALTAEKRRKDENILKNIDICKFRYMTSLPLYLFLLAHCFSLDCYMNAVRGVHASCKISQKTPGAFGELQNSIQVQDSSKCRNCAK